MSTKNGQQKEPWIRMVKRDAISQKKAWAIRAAAFILSLVTGGIVILLLGHNPFSVYTSMVVGAFGSSTVIHETVKIAVPLLITAIGISFAFKMKFWNIGGEGQILVGAVAAGAFGLFTAHIFPKLPLVILMMLASIVAGGLYGLLPAVCKAKWGTNETLFTLMLNYIALAFIKYLMNGPWKAEGSSFPKIAMLVPGARLTKVLGVHWGWILALVLVVVSYIYFNRPNRDMRSLLWARVTTRRAMRESMWDVCLREPCLSQVRSAGLWECCSSRERTTRLQKEPPAAWDLPRLRWRGLPR